MKDLKQLQLVHITWVTKPTVELQHFRSFWGQHNTSKKDANKWATFLIHSINSFLQNIFKDELQLIVGNLEEKISITTYDIPLKMSQCS